MLFEDIGISKVDLNREKLKGFPEVIYGEHKTAEQIVKIALKLIGFHQKVLITRMAKNKWDEIKEHLPQEGTYYEEAQIYTFGKCRPLEKKEILRYYVQELPTYMQLKKHELLLNGWVAK